MSKKRSHNRPNKEREGKFRHIPAQKPEIDLVDHTRRKILIGSAVAAALGFIGFGFFRENGFSCKTVDENTELKSVTNPKSPQYNEWASGVKLPEINIKNAPISLEEARLGLPQGIGRDVLKSLSQKFQSDKKTLSEKLSGIMDVKQRQALIRKFFENLVNDNMNYLLILRPKMTNDPEEVIRALNRLLMHENSWIESNYGSIPESRRFAVYNIEGVKKSSIKIGDRTIDLPILFLHNQEDLLENMDDSESVLMGQYFNDDEYLVINKDGLLRLMKEQTREISQLNQEAAQRIESIAPEEKYSQLQKSTIYHEVAHVALQKIYGINHKESLIEMNGLIDMDGYSVGRDLKITDTELHELAANGYGIMNSGKMAKGTLIYLLNSPYPSYRLAKEICIKELQRIMGPGIHDTRALKLFIIDADDQALHRIGERMAKLAIHLARKGQI